MYQKQKKLNDAADFLEQSLETLQIMHGQNSSHPQITAVQCELADVYESQGGILEPNTETDGAGDGSR